jgi:hypothetical protein
LLSPLSPHHERTTPNTENALHIGPFAFREPALDEPAELVEWDKLVLPKNDLDDIRRNDIRRNDIRRNDIRRNDIRRNDIRRNDIRRNDIRRNAPGPNE